MKIQIMGRKMTEDIQKWLKNGEFKNEKKKGKKKIYLPEWGFEEHRIREAFFHLSEKHNCKQSL